MKGRKRTYWAFSAAAVILFAVGITIYDTGSPCDISHAEASTPKVRVLDDFVERSDAIVKGRVVEVNEGRFLSGADWEESGEIVHDVFVDPAQILLAHPCLGEPVQIVVRGGVVIVPQEMVERKGWDTFSNGPIRRDTSIVTSLAVGDEVVVFLNEREADGEQYYGLVRPEAVLDFENETLQDRTGTLGISTTVDGLKNAIARLWTTD